MYSKIIGWTDLSLSFKHWSWPRNLCMMTGKLCSEALLIIEALHTTCSVLMGYTLVMVVSCGFLTVPSHPDSNALQDPHKCCNSSVCVCIVVLSNQMWFPLCKAVYKHPGIPLWCEQWFLVPQWHHCVHSNFYPQYIIAHSNNYYAEYRVLLMWTVEVI